MRWKSRRRFCWSHTKQNVISFDTNYSMTIFVHLSKVHKLFENPWLRPCLTFHHHTRATAVSFRNSVGRFSGDTSISKKAEFEHRSAFIQFAWSVSVCMCVCGIGCNCSPRSTTLCSILRCLLFIAHSFFSCVMSRCTNTCADACCCLLTHTKYEWVLRPWCECLNSKVKPCELTECILNIIVGIFIYIHK